MSSLQGQLAEGERAREAARAAEAERDAARQREAEGLQLKLQAVTQKLADLESNTLPGLQRSNQALESRLLVPPPAPPSPCRRLG